VKEVTEINKSEVFKPYKELCAKKLKSKLKSLFANGKFIAFQILSPFHQLKPKTLSNPEKKYAIDK
jgi:hypothetical protein